VKKNTLDKTTNRRTFLKQGTVAAGATLGAGLLGTAAAATTTDRDRPGRLTKGDAAILRFLQVIETIESDLWQQYAELGGQPKSTDPTVSKIDLPFNTGGSPAYIAALQFLDGDMAQYIADNTDDEFSHRDFLTKYLQSKGADLADLTPFFGLPSSQCDGANKTAGRLTNLMQLTVDTSWWVRYRSDSGNPDLGDSFPQAIPSLNKGQHPAIPRNNADIGINDLSKTPPVINDHLQAIANTAGFHFAFIEQGGSSLYPQLAQRVTHPEVLRILLSIGPTETSHFQTWHDKAGNAPNVTDGDLTFNPLNGTSTPEDLQTNLIMPEPTIFLDRKFPKVSIIRPTETKDAAMATAVAFIEDGLFIGQPPAFFEMLKDLAADADAARRE
jgi:hypothetical protein